MGTARPRAVAVACKVFIVLGLFLSTSCSSTHRAPGAEDPFVVEGTVTVRGNEPFIDLFLETEDRNSYVLVFEEGEGTEMQRVAPGRFRVVGLLYRGDWNGKPYALVAVSSWMKL